MKNPKCCEVESVWVENVPGKGYYFCKDCKNEVKEPDHTTNIPQWHYSADKGWYQTTDMPPSGANFMAGGGTFDWNLMSAIPGDETEEG